MTEKIITCITCPIGCRITVRGEKGKVVSMEGHQCARGETYGESEFLHPVRILTSVVGVKEALVPLVAVRSRDPLPKELLFDCMKVIRSTTVDPPIRCGDRLIPNILGTGVDIIATADVPQ